MGDVQELAQRLEVNEDIIYRWIQICVEKKIIPPPERGEDGRLILSEEAKQQISKVRNWREREISSVTLLAEELYLTPGGLRSMIRRLVKKGVIPPLEVKKGRVTLTPSQRRKIRKYYKWIRKKAPVTSLAEELGVKPWQIRQRVYKLIREGKISKPLKRRRGSIVELLLTPKMEKEIRNSFAKRKRG